MQGKVVVNSMSFSGPLVSVSWLAKHLSHPNLVVLDASLQPAAAPANSSFQHKAYIPGSRIFDFDQKICDRTSPLPHMMPSPEQFERDVRTLGINQQTLIVIYDRVGVYASPRAWWMFKAMGHDQVAVLDGGLPAWLEAGLPTEPFEAHAFPPGNFVANPLTDYFCTADQVLSALNEMSCVVLDARSEARFYGRDPEPRSGVRAGHMPNALNLPFSAVQKDGRMRPMQELISLFSTKAKQEQKLIFSCGSGVTACILALAANLAGYQNLSVYDGSWSEWGLPSSYPVTQT